MSQIHKLFPLRIIEIQQCGVTIFAMKGALDLPVNKKIAELNQHV